MSQGIVTKVLKITCAPTRVFVERWKQDGNLPTARIDAWNQSCWFITAALIVVFYCVGQPSLDHAPYLWLLLLFPFSRINELALAFYHDAFERFGDSEGTDHVRLRRLFQSYLEVAIQFGLLYFALPLKFKTGFQSPVDSIYFSAITITTVGYGDFIPVGPAGKLMCIYELAVGFLLVVFALGSYLSTATRRQNMTENP